MADQDVAPARRARQPMKCLHEAEIGRQVNEALARWRALNEYAVRRVGAEDLRQAAWADALEHAGKYQPAHPGARGYFRTIAMRTIRCEIFRGLAAASIPLRPDRPERRPSPFPSAASFSARYHLEETSRMKHERMEGLAARPEIWGITGGEMWAHVGGDSS